MTRRCASNMHEGCWGGCMCSCKLSCLASVVRCFEHAALLQAVVQHLLRYSAAWAETRCGPRTVRPTTAALSLPSRAGGQAAPAAA